MLAAAFCKLGDQTKGVEEKVQAFARDLEDEIDYRGDMIADMVSHPLRESLVPLCSCTRDSVNQTQWFAVPRFGPSELRLNHCTTRARCLILTLTPYPWLESVGPGRYLVAPSFNGVCSHLVSYHGNSPPSHSHAALQCIQGSHDMAHKVGVYATLVGLLNRRNGHFGANVVDQLGVRFDKAIRRGECSECKVTNSDSHMVSSSRASFQWS